MSTASLPSYVEPSDHSAPTYSAHPQPDETRLAHSNHAQVQSSRDFFKKHGDVSLQLTGHGKDPFPIYSQGDLVEGAVHLNRLDGIESVEVTIEGRLRLVEIAEGGTTTSRLCLNTMSLWTRDPMDAGSCPPSLPFRLQLPSTFSHEDITYPLPPSFEVHLEGVPGFSANIDYTVSATVNKHSIVPSTIFGFHIGNTPVSTPIRYYPRTKPTVPLPSALIPSANGFIESPEWRLFESKISAKTADTEDITSKLYLPASRVFSISQKIPFHLSLHSSAQSLAACLPFGPTANFLTSKRPTRIELMRQSAVDVRNHVVAGTKTDIFRVDCIGSGTFKFSADGPNWVAFDGEISINDGIEVAGFKAAGLSIKDCVVLSMVPPDPSKSLFKELRQLIPLQLVTDIYASGKNVIGAFGVSELSIPTSTGDYFKDTPALNYA